MAAGGSSYRSQSNGPAGIMGQLERTGGIAMNKLHDHVTGAQANNYLATLNPGVNQDDATAFNTLNVYTAGPIAATGRPGSSTASVRLRHLHSLNANRLRLSRR